MERIKTQFYENVYPHDKAWRIGRALERIGLCTLAMLECMSFCGCCDDKEVREIYIKEYGKFFNGKSNLENFIIKSVF